jgi:sodium pump decarboxylase gamma subunit
MSADTVSAIYISVIALGIIFLVLTILIFTIKAIDALFPYKAPPPPPAKKQAPQQAASAETEEHIAAIAPALSMALGRSPSEINIVRIDSA